MPDRNTPPALQQVDKLEINNFRTAELSNNTPLYIVDGAEEEIVKIDWRFHAGRWYETQPAIARNTLQMLRKGTFQKTARHIADAIEFYGCDLDFTNGNDTTSISLTCLNKHLENVLPVVVELLQEAAFPDHELEMMIQRQKQRLRINEKNTEFYANRSLYRMLFGDTHPYGYAVDDAILDNLSTDGLRRYHRDFYKNAPSTLFVAGNVSDSILNTLDTYYGSIPVHNTVSRKNDISIRTSGERKIYKELTEAVQASVRIGKISIPKTHPDFLAYNIMMILFGGYFGSRLMRNIREEKGYCYGIHATTWHSLHASYMIISTEVGNEVCEDAIEEVYREMDVLRNEKVSETELSIVRNYVMGNILQATDGPFNRIKTITNLVLLNMDTSYYDAYMHTLQAITPERIQEMAVKYLVKEDMIESICGNLSKS